MAVEPSALRVCVSAHDDNGGQVEPSCTQDQIGASSDVTLPLNRKVMEAHDADLEEASRGLEPSRERVLASELQVSASPGALSEQLLSGVARRVYSA